MDHFHGFIKDHDSTNYSHRLCVLDTSFVEQPNKHPIRWFYGSRLH